MTLQSCPLDVCIQNVRSTQKPPTPVVLSISDSNLIIPSLLEKEKVDKPHFCPQIYIDAPSYGSMCSSTSTARPYTSREKLQPGSFQFSPKHSESIHNSNLRSEHNRHFGVSSMERARQGFGTRQGRRW